MSLLKNTLVKIELNLTGFVHTFGHHQRFFFKIHFYQNTTGTSDAANIHATHTTADPVPHTRT
jgi:hypothetical protein